MAGNEVSVQLFGEPGRARPLAAAPPRASGVAVTADGGGPLAGPDPMSRLVVVMLFVAAALVGFGVGSDGDDASGGRPLPTGVARQTTSSTW